MNSLLSHLAERARAWPGHPAPPGQLTPPRLSGVPLLGHTPDFLTNPLGLLTRAHRELGEVCGLQVGHKNVVAVFGPRGHEAVFRAPDELLNPQEAYRFITPIFGKGVVYDAPLPVMGEQVKMLLPALQDRRMRTYGESIVREVQESIAGWGDEGVIDLVDYCRVLTNFTSSRCLLGVEFRERMSDEFAAIYHDLERGITPIAYLNPHLPLPAFIRRDRARVRLVRLVTEIVGERRRQGRTGEDFLQTLMEARYSDGRPLTEEEITGLLVAAMFAGHHTSSVTTAWTLLELMRNWVYLGRMVDQIDGVLGDGGAFTMQTARQLTLTEWAIKEGLRLHPPLFLLIRVAQADWQVLGYHVPRGSWVVVSPTVSHHSDRYFKNPERFDPERFSPGRQDEVVEWSYVPFGGGRHKCLGNAFALLQVKTILGVLLSRYEFDLYGDPVMDDFQSMVIGPREPCRLRYRRRDHRTKVVVPAAAPVAAQESGCPAHRQVATPAQAHKQPPAQPTPAQAAAPAQAHKQPPAQPAPAQAAAPRLRVVLDLDLCQGHSACIGEAPEVFDLSPEGKVMLRIAQPGPEHYDRLRAAERHCPNGTIQLIAE